MRIGGLLACLSLAFLPPKAGAEGLTPLLLEFGEPRTLLWGILEERPQNAVSLAFHLADQLALNPDRQGKPFLIGASLTFTPLFRYDRNVNNGFRGDTIHIWGLPFEVDENTRAVEAATVGGAVAGGISFGLARGTTLTLALRSEYRRAIGKEFEVFNNTAAMSIGHTTETWTYLNAAFLVNEEKRALSDDNIKIASFTMGKLLGEAGSNLHDISGTFIRAEESSAWQSRARVDWVGTYADHGLFKLGLERGEKIEGALLPTTTMTASYANILFGAPTMVSTSYRRKTGGSFFGAARADDIYQVKVDRRITDRISIHASYERKDSTIDAFDDSGLDIGFDIAGFRF